MHLKRLISAIWALIVLLCAQPARADHFRLALDGDDDLYIADILALALKATGDDHSIEIVSRVLLLQDKALAVLNEPNRRYDMHYSGYTPAREKAYSMVNFPITRGMLGHRLLAVTEANRDLLAEVRSLADLRTAATLGSGTDWPDTGILQAAGLNVITGNDRLLWPMLARGRFDAFPRGLNEYAAQIAHEGGGKYGVTLVMEPHIMLLYRFDLFFFLPKAESAKARIIEKGLQAALKSGELDRLLESMPRNQQMLADLTAHPRRVITIPNPVLDNNTSIPAHYWRIYP